MKKFLPVLLLACLLTTDCLARGGFSSSGGRGGFSSSSRSYGSGSSRSYSAPSRSYSSPSRSYSAPSHTYNTSRSNTTVINRSYGGGGGGYRHYYAPGYGYHPYMYPGFGMGFGYSNGLIEGLIIGNLMHPSGTTVYSGGGYHGNALLYPSGQVVDQNGYQVGTYQNGQFTAQQGGMIAQQAPAGADQQMQQPAPVVVQQNPGYGVLAWMGIIILSIILIFIIIMVLGL